ncbi:UDP-N-acetylmuramoyl-L-alanine--D-glutamate ligase, partial [Escherichia coli]|nr:UDP-N-acetylmuramoyl-L-alanine--D-glutamate ligase [Escherichia coli]
LRGLHNVENILAAFAACIACRAPLEKIRNSVSEFRGVEHRIEYVSEIRGIKFFNDSKATSVDATAKALEAFSEESGRIVLIMGGRGKN